MNTSNRRSRFLCLVRSAFLAGLLLPAAGLAAQAPQSPAFTGIENVTHWVGLNAKPGSSGDLVFDEQAMALYESGQSTTIPLRSILAFSVTHGDKPLIGGTKGKLAGVTPYGIGFAITMTRPAADTLTLFYGDSNRAIHGCVLILPKDAGGRAVSALAAELGPSEYPKSGILTPVEAPAESGPRQVPSSTPANPDVVVSLPSVGFEGIPAAFSAAVYENLIAQLTQSGRFANVWREGDIRRAPDAMVLHVHFETWKAGSPRKRGFGPFAGITKIESTVTLVDKSGQAIFHTKASGTKRSRGESLDAASSLAKHVRKALEKAPSL